ncbi:MAG: hypothetical protein D084_Lepto4C00189G0002 [Leptospirillum sp. Group IV 'UBA BS']|nr:MAG: hypothetical protein D084_Lepto4C00189G0002 [Leptospirillum sp. Group IV 'UBA BS']
MNPNMIDTSRPEDIPVLADLLADLFSMETDFSSTTTLWK